MNCPVKKTLYEYLRGEAPVPRRSLLDEHLDQCSSCRGELESLARLEAQMAEWPDEEPGDDFVHRVMGRLDSEASRQRDILPQRLSGPVSWPPWVARAATIAATVAATLLIQIGVWTPLASPERVRTVLAYAAPPEIEKSIGPDSGDMVRVTAHGPDRFSCEPLEGRFSITALIAELKRRFPESTYRYLVLRGEDREEPVTVDLDRLAPMAEAFQISSILIGSGISATFQQGEEAARVVPPGSTGSEDSRLVEAILSPSRVVLVTGPGNRYHLNRSVVQEVELSDALRKLVEASPELSLLVLARQGQTRDALGEIIRIANELGIEQITIKTEVP